MWADNGIDMDHLRVLGENDSGQIFGIEEVDIPYGQPDTGERVTGLALMST